LVVKKLIAMLIIGGVMAAGVVGCGPAASTAPPTSTDKKDKDKDKTTSAPDKGTNTTDKKS
jgi:hypothetical protein